MSQAAELAAALNSSELLRLIDAHIDEATALCVSGTIAADERHHHPWGLIHGGLYTSAIETFATIGALLTVRHKGQQVVGVCNTTEVVRPHRSGRLRVAGIPIIQAPTYQLWHVEIRTDDDENKLIARGQVRIQNIEPQCLPHSSDDPDCMTDLAPWPSI
jgi:1,4-dihydroxy-2-naphthoyl-CoA hydrolase